MTLTDAGPPTPDNAPANETPVVETNAPPRKRRRVFALSILTKGQRASLKALTLIVATALSLVATVGQFYFVDSAEGAAKQLGEEMRSIEARTETLRTAQSAYFNAQVQGNLLFALNPADRSINKGVVADLYSLALYDQAFPFRSILGELAIAGAITFKTVNDDYNALRERAMTDLDYASFTAVGEFERKILNDAMTLHGQLQDRYWKAREERSAAEAETSRRRALLLAIGGLATCLFLVANLITIKD